MRNKFSEDGQRTHFNPPDSVLFENMSVLFLVLFPVTPAVTVAAAAVVVAAGAVVVTSTCAPEVDPGTDVSGAVVVASGPWETPPSPPSGRAAPPSPAAFSVGSLSGSILSIVPVSKVDKKFLKTFGLLFPPGQIQELDGEPENKGRRSMKKKGC